MRRDPLEIVMAFSDFLKTKKEGETYTLNEIKNATGLHYRTVQSYAFLVHHIQSRLPSINLEESGRAARIRIVKNPSFDKFSLEDELVLYLFDKGAIRKSMAIRKPTWFPDVESLVTRGLVEESEHEAISLTLEGMLRGAELADVREDELIQPMGEAITESRKPIRIGEAKEFIGDWLKTAVKKDFPLVIADLNPAVATITLSSKEYTASMDKDRGSVKLVDKTRAM